MPQLINVKTSRPLTVALGVIPLMLVIWIYLGASSARLAENPSDKMLPSPGTMVDSMHRMAFEPSKRTGQYLLLQDTIGSLKRLFIGVSIASLVGLCWGLLTGAIPVFRSLLSPLLTVVSLIPTLALLPILFIVFGLGEVSKIALIVFGITPFIARDIQKRTLEVPAEQIIKAQTLGAGTSQIVLRVLLPQILPKLINAIRLSLGAGWLFLIAAEAIASTDGLGYRIFLSRRYLAMDVILPYVMWITLLAFLIDSGLRQLDRSLFRWDHARDDDD